MDDSADEAVPEADAAQGRPPVVNVLAGSARGRDSQREPSAPSLNTVNAVVGVAPISRKTALSC